MNLLSKIGDLFEKRHLYRRLVVVYVCWLTAYLTIDSIDAIKLAIIHKADLLNLGGALATVGIPVGAILAFTMKLYWGGRSGNEDDNN